MSPGARETPDAGWDPCPLGTWPGVHPGALPRGGWVGSFSPLGSCRLSLRGSWKAPTPQPPPQGRVSQEVSSFPLAEEMLFR